MGDSPPFVVRSGLESGFEPDRVRDAGAAGFATPAGQVPDAGDGSDRATARSVARGIMRLFAQNDIWCLPEMPLRNGRRADLMGIDAKGRVVIVEIKVARGDLLGDGKWPDYLDFCDRFYWGVPPGLDRTPLEGEHYRPDCCGIIVADGYGAEILRPAPLHPLASARRRCETERLARAALRRLAVSGDPHCAQWGGAWGAAD